MGLLSRFVAGLLVMASLLAAGLAGGAAAAPNAVPPVGLTYTITGLPKGSTLTVLYLSGIAGNRGGSAQARSGSMSFVHFLGAHSLEVSSSNTGSLTADVTEDVDAAGATISGKADVPSGATVKLRDDATDQQIDLRNGEFSINTTSLSRAAHRVQPIAVVTRDITSAKGER